MINSVLVGYYALRHFAMDVYKDDFYCFEILSIWTLRYVWMDAEKASHDYGTRSSLFISRICDNASTFTLDFILLKLFGRARDDPIFIHLYSRWVFNLLLGNIDIDTICRPASVEKMYLRARVKWKRGMSIMYERR